MFAVLSAAVVTAFAAPAMAGSIKVNPGESIQDAVDAAQPGDSVIVYPGVYIEDHTGPAVRITKSLKLIGKSKGTEKVILQGAAGQTHGILVEPENPGVDPDIEGFQIKGFTVQGFQNNGIYLRYVDGFKIQKNESIDNLENGIFPTLSANGQVKKNLSYGSEDAALWVEGSENVRVMKNIIHSSPTGLEVTVSNNVEMKGNEIYNNTTGVGLYHPSAAALPPLAEMGNWEVTKNYIHDNNAANTAPPGSMAASLPPGGGLLILGSDGAIVTGNTIENNDFYGVSIVDYCTAVGGGPFDCDDVPPEVEHYPDGNKIQGNTLINNGTAPDPMHPLAPYASDLTYIVFDSTPGNQNHGNCYAKNDYSTSQRIGDQPIFFGDGGNCF